MATAGAFGLLLAPVPAFAVGTTVGLGTAASYSVLGGQAVTNTGSSVLSGNVGVSPETSITGFPPGTINGDLHAADAHALQAQSDLTIAYNNAAGQATDGAVGPELGGQTLTAGVYTASSSAQLTGPLTLDAQGDPDAVFIFQIGSGLTTASRSSVVLLNDAQSCHVFWQVGTSATLGTGSSFVGTIMALTSITANTGATVEGRALARNGAVTLDNNVFTDVTCATTSTGAPSSPAPTDTNSPSPTAIGTGTGSTTPTSTGSGSALPSSTGSAAASASPSGPGFRGTPTASASDAVAAAGDNGSGDSSRGPLAITGGGPSGPLVAIAFSTIVAGAGLVLVSRRRRTS